VTLTPEQAQAVREAADALVAHAVRDPKQGPNPGTVARVVESLDPEPLQALVSHLLTIQMSLGLAFQRAVYARPSSMIHIAAAGLAQAGLGEVLAEIFTTHPETVDREGAARRAQWAVGETNRIAITTAAGSLILPEGFGEH